MISFAISFFMRLMCVVRADLRVVAADHGDRAAQHAGLDAVDQRLGGAQLVDVRVGDAVQALLDRLDRIADGGVGLELRNVDQLGAAVLEVANGQLDDLLRVLARVLLVELDEVGIGHLRDIGSGDELRVEALA